MEKKQLVTRRKIVPDCQKDSEKQENQHCTLDQGCLFFKVQHTVTRIKNSLDSDIFVSGHWVQRCLLSALPKQDMHCLSLSSSCPPATSWVHGSATKPAADGTGSRAGAPAFPCHPLALQLSLTSWSSFQLLSYWRGLCEPSQHQWCGAAFHFMMEVGTDRVLCSHCERLLHNS